MTTLTTADLPGVERDADAPLSPVERAALKLRDAVALGTPAQVDRAAKRLERARDAEDRETRRAKDRLQAEIAAREIKSLEARAAKSARADAAEAQLRKNTPTVVFYACGKRIVVTMSTPGVEYGWAPEACRRIAWKIAGTFAGRVAASRGRGEVAPDPDWLPAFLQDQSGGLLDHVRRGVVKVENE